MLTHVDPSNKPKMVDIKDKVSTARHAWARSKVLVPQEVFTVLSDGAFMSKKGPIFSTAIIAGTMAVKKTSDLIPFCHPLQIESCDFSIFTEDHVIIIDCKISVHHKTGVEMEALTGASVAALTIYDMCKALSHDLQIISTELMAKSGGKSDFKRKI